MSEDITPIDLSDRISEAYYGLIPEFSEEFFERTRRRVHWICAQAKGDNILDIGCSQGVMSILLAREGKKCLGLDVNAKSIEQALSYLQKEPNHVQNNVTFVHTDATLYDYAGQQFDTILLTEVLEHLLHPSRLVDLAACLLNPNGRLVITLPFGVNAYLDHKATYYGHRAYELLTRHFFVVDIVLLEGWIGFIATNDPASCHIPPLTAWENTEDEFLAMEQSLRNNLSKTQSQFKALKTQQVSREAEFSRKLKEAETKAKEAQTDFDAQLAAAAAREADLTRKLEEAATKAKEAQADFDEQSVAAAAREADLTRKLEEAEIQAQEARADFDEKLSSAAAKENEYARQLKETESKAKEAQADFDEQSVAAAAREADLTRKLKETEGRMNQEAGQTRTLRDMLIEAIVEKDRLAAVNQAQLRFLQREAYNTWDSRAAAILRTASSPSSLALLPVKLHKLQREEKGRAPKSLGGDSFSELITAYANGGFDQVDALFIQTSASPVVKANGYTALARHLKNVDAKQVCEAARRAYEEDPRPYRRKWLAFQLYAAGNAHGADILLSTLPEDLALSLSESRQLKKIRASAERERISLGKAKLNQCDKQSGNKAVKGNAGRQSSIYFSDDALIFTAHHAKQDPLHGHPAPQKKLPLLAATGDRKLRIAAIMDTFTYHAYAPEADVLQLHPEQWERQFEDFKPDIVFIESAWEGMDNLWNKKISAVSPEFKAMMVAAHTAGIPSLFWNKEDPVHYATFLNAAALADYVFTTDIDCIPHYKSELGHENVFLLPFAAQPEQHNPLEKYARKNAFNFAGSYYLRYPQRQHDFKTVVDAATAFLPVEIYDRNHHRQHPHYTFPATYHSMILGFLDVKDIDLAYKGYRFGINMNTIKQSQTMFARRVFELLASNTMVVSNYSHGMRLFFGDLVLSSDSEQELRKTLHQWTTDETFCRKLRLLGLRKVMQEHTYFHRLAYIRSKLGDAPQQKIHSIHILAKVASREQAAIVKKSFESQIYAHKRLLLLSSIPLDADNWEGAYICATLEEVKLALRDAGPDDLFGIFDPEDYYDPHYLTDLSLAFHYLKARAVGKTAFYQAEQEAGYVPVLENDGLQYTVVEGLPARASLVRYSAMDEATWSGIAQTPDAIFNPPLCLAVDEFSYVRNGAALPLELLASALVQPLPDQGMPLEAIRDLAAKQPDVPLRASSEALPRLSAQELFELLRTSFSNGPVQGSLVNGRLRIQSNLPQDKHKYFYCDTFFTREEVHLKNNSQICLHVSEKKNLKTVFEFYDANRNKLSHSMSQAGYNQTLAIPEDCTLIRFGLRVQGPGDMSIDRLEFGQRSLPTTLFVSRSPYLVLAKQYPNYDDLYKYGFLHARVRSYKEHGLITNVFRLHPEIPASPYYAYEGVNVMTGDGEQLKSLLRSGQVKHVLAHLLDNQMWEIVREYLDTIKLTIWVHGAEIRTWQRRLYNFEQKGETEIERQKKLSKNRMAMWRDIVNNPHPNVHLVFVSRNFQNEVMHDLGLSEFSRDSTSVIHNVIDGDLFSYNRKKPEHRTRIISLRPYTSLKYANDLTVKAILELSQRPFFDELFFHLVGEGELFDETTAPLTKFNNVKLEKTFLPQPEIAKLHSDYGIFLTPTRDDSQGVSRDEAMASGLVPITNRVAAIPEFVDENCGLVVPPEDHMGLADAVETLYRDPELFLRLSKGAAERVRRQSGFEQTIMREMGLISCMSANRPK